MAELLRTALTFPCVVYTVLLGVVLLYWTFVLSGIVHLGEGTEGALDVDAGHAPSGEADLGDAHGDAGLLASFMSALKLNRAPATLVFSLIVTFAWLASMLAMPSVSGWSWARGWAGSLLVLALAPVVALPFTSLLVRPLAPLFAQRVGLSRRQLVGRTCTVRTGTVSAKFGEATVEDGGAGLVVPVRVDGERAIARGEQVLIIDWDEEREAFVVEPLSELEARR